MFERSIQIVAKRLAEEVKAGKNHALYRLDNSSNQGAEIAKVTLASNNLPNILLLQKKVVTLQSTKNKIMEATIASSFNPTQIQLLKMFEADKSEKGLQELKEVLFKYYYQKMNNSLNELWESGALDQKRLDEINEMDLHQI